jgi:hypothetical protein
MHYTILEGDIEGLQNFGKEISLEMSTWKTINVGGILLKLLLREHMRGGQH